MKAIILFLALVALSAARTRHSLKVNESLDELWGKYKKSFEKNYKTEVIEFARRMIWERNLQEINRHNSESDMGYHSYRLGLNEYSDMMTHEFNKVMNGLRLTRYHMQNASVEFVDENTDDLPKEIDWRKEGYVTKVKNQKSCGSCWAFSATGSLEGQYFKKTGKLVALSEQDLMDCSSNCGSGGCDGGLMDDAFKCMKAEGGIESEKDYPYEARDDICRFNRKKVVTSLTDYVDIKHSEKALQKAVATIGPISIAIDASGVKFHQYKDGVYENPDCSSVILDHGVLLVGYGTENGKDYWLVKNSWGKKWGINGYIKMVRNKKNMCGVATLASYPVL